MTLRRHAFALLERVRRAPALHRLVNRLGRTAAGRPLIRWMTSEPRGRTYADWVRRYDTLSDADRALIRQRMEGLKHRPTISIVMPAYDTAETLMERAVESVRAQIYPHWELCIADDASPGDALWRRLEAFRAADPRIRIVRRRRNGHISAATNSALALATGDYVALMDHDDVLCERALYEMVLAVERCPEAVLIYSDEDKIDSAGRRFEPYFKPDFNYELLLQQNLVSHLGLYRRDVLNELGGLRSAFDGSQDYDLALRVCERFGAERIVHVPAVLYHWRQNDEAMSFSEAHHAKCIDAARRAVEAHLAARGETAHVTPRPNMSGWLRVQRAPPSPPPLVSVVLDGPMGCGETAGTRGRRIVQDTDYPSIELAGADASAATGEILLFLDSDLEPASEGWLQELVAQAVRPDVGAVGGRVLDARGRLEDAGLVLGGGGVRPLCAEAVAWDHGPWGHLALIREVGALSGACLAMRREVYEAVAGLDPDLPLRTAAVDLCLKLRRAGYRLVWTPEAEMKRSGAAARVTLAPDGRALAARWGPALDADRFYNPNLDLKGCDYRLGFPPPLRPSWRV